MTTNTRVRSHVRSVIDQDGAVLLDLESGAYFSLNEVAAEIWSGLEAGLSRQGIVERVASAFAVARETVEEDVDRFLATLQKRGMLDDGE